MKRTLWVLAAAAIGVSAQEHDHHQMAGHQMAGHDMPMGNDPGMYLMQLASGTSINPQSWPMPMLMPTPKLMLMGQAYITDTQQSGSRGGDKFFSTNWFMAAYQVKAGRGAFLLQGMLSLDPATVTNRSYPLLFQTGETAYGRPLIDAQHPHDLFMGLGIHYARPLGENTIVHAYYAPVGDPALGPVAYPHRASAFELPQATLGHHWQDSTHIAINVATVALKHKWLRLEASGFHGTEPDENRWNLDWGAMNSYSGRVSVFPAKNWMAQVSAGRLTAPEGEGDVVRTTASLHYTRPMGRGNAWSTSLIWGRNHDIHHRQNLNSYLAETLYPATRNNFVTARIEMVDKNELFGEHGASFRVQAYTAGYTRDIARFSGIETGAGANVTAYAIPPALQGTYGERPWGVNIFVRFRLRSDE